MPLPSEYKRKESFITLWKENFNDKEWSEICSQCGCSDTMVRVEIGFDKSHSEGYDY